MQAIVLPIAIVVLFGSIGQCEDYHYPDGDTTPRLDYLVLDPWLAYYTTQSTLTALPRTYSTRRPVGGAYGSCEYSAPGGTTTSDTCLSYIRSNTATGCTYLGEPCQVSWACQSTTSSVGPSTIYFCGCNSNDPAACPNFGSCQQLDVDATLEVVPNTDEDLPPFDAGSPGLTLNRSPSYCECAAGYQHWRRAGAVEYGPGDPREASVIPMQTTVGFFDPLISGDDLIVAPCTRVTDIVCPNGIPSYLYLEGAAWTIDYANFIPCYSNERGTPGCGVDVIPCICDAGYFGPTCGIAAFASNKCGYSDLATPPPGGTFDLGALCMSRGTCAGGSYDFLLQNPKSPYYNTALVYCTSCVGDFWGAQCRDTCGYTDANATTVPNCPEHATCQNPGTHLAPTPECVCDAGYVDPYNDGQPGSPTDDSTNCLTCINEIGTHVPTCNSVGTCPTATYKCSLLGCPIATHIPSVPLQCVCPSYFVDMECAVPNNITYTCGAQNIAVTCAYTRAVAFTDFRFDCIISETLSTGTTPNEAYPMSVVCHDVSLTDTDILSGYDLLRLWQGDDGCAAVRTQCTAEYGEDICPIPFRDFDVVVGRPANAFCDPPDVRQYLKAVYGPVEETVSVFCWMVSESPDKFQCQTPPLSTGALLISNCVLAISWSAYITRPDAMATAIQQFCNP